MGAKAGEVSETGEGVGDAAVALLVLLPAAEGEVAFSKGERDDR